jgi:hypothetical protein
LRSTANDQKKDFRISSFVKEMKSTTTTAQKNVKLIYHFLVWWAEHAFKSIVFRREERSEVYGKKVNAWSVLCVSFNFMLFQHFFLAHEIHFSSDRWSFSLPDIQNVSWTSKNHWDVYHLFQSWPRLGHHFQISF